MARRRKEILGLYLSETEGANFWLPVITGLQNLGVKIFSSPPLIASRVFSRRLMLSSPRSRCNYASSTKSASL